MRNGLVVLQIALSVALLVGAGLLTKSFYELQRAGTGFDADSAWTARVALPDGRYDAAAAARFFERALATLGALPGVTAAAYTSSLPFSGDVSQGSVLVEGFDTPDGQAPPHAFQRAISAGLLPALGIPIVMGRNFELAETEPVAIVDEVMANRYWPGGNALGQRIGIDAGDWYTVIGIVPTVKHTALTEETAKETVYWHYSQSPRRQGALVLRSSLPPDELTRVATDAISRLDPDVALFDVRPMRARVEGSLGPQRTPMVLTLVFAGIALSLAVVGIYGVLSWAVTQRLGEIGVRIALGARNPDIVGLFLKHGTRLIVTGVAIGLVAAAVLGRVLSSQIYNVSYADPGVYLFAALSLTATALLASWLPARRASRIDPIRALKDE